MGHKPLTREEYEALIVQTFPTGVRSDLVRISGWVKKRGESWPREVSVLKNSLCIQIEQLHKLLDEAKPDTLIASYHHSLWAKVNEIKRSLDRPYLETGKKLSQSGKQGAEMSHGTPQFLKRRKADRIASVEKYVSEGLGKDAAVALAAEDYEISTRQMYRVLSR